MYYRCMKRRKAGEGASEIFVEREIAKAGKFDNI
jgi:hypothetical protein